MTKDSAQMKTPSRARPVAFVVAGLSLLIVAVSVVLAILFGLTPEIPILAWGVAAPVLGILLVVRAGAVQMGGLLLAIGFFGSVAALAASVHLGPDNLELLPLMVVGGVGWLAFLGLTLAGLPLLYPTGRPPGRRWRPLWWLLLTMLAVASLMLVFSSPLVGTCSDASTSASCSEWEQSGQAIAIHDCQEIGGARECDVTVENPIGISWVPPMDGSAFGNVLLALLLVTSLIAIVSLGVRMRRGSAQERQQIKFLLAAAGIFLAGTLIEFLVVDLLRYPLSGAAINILDFIGWTAIPVAIFLAITRYRLYEIDRFISRSVTYAVVIGLLAGAVALVSTLVGTRFDSPLVVAATTLAVAAAFNPVRRRVQAVVDRRFNRPRYDAQRVMDDFAGSLRDQIDAESVISGYMEVIQRTMHPDRAGIWVKGR